MVLLKATHTGCICMYNIFDISDLRLALEHLAGIHNQSLDVKIVKIANALLSTKELSSEMQLLRTKHQLS